MAVAASSSTKTCEDCEDNSFFYDFRRNVEHLGNFWWLILPPFGHEIRWCLAVSQATQKHIISRWKKELGKAVF